MLCLLGQPGWWNPIKWPCRSWLGAWGKKKSPVGLYSTERGIKRKKWNWRELPWQQEISGYTGDRASSGLSTELIAIRVKGRWGLWVAQLWCIICEWRPWLVMRAWISHQSCRQDAHKWLLFTSVSQSHTYPPCWAAGWDGGDEPAQSHNAIFLSLVLFFSRLQGGLVLKVTSLCH